jgi:hypothetical protein
VPYRSKAELPTPPKHGPKVPLLLLYLLLLQLLLLLLLLTKVSRSPAQCLGSSCAQLICDTRCPPAAQKQQLSYVPCSGALSPVNSTAFLAHKATTATPAAGSAMKPRWQVCNNKCFVKLC